MSNDIQLLKLALKYAKLAEGFCAPNPAVGAIVVKHGEIISSGYHQGPGTLHAERAALNKLTPSQAKDATLYVTLEPCFHHGRTPPCSDIIIEKQIKRVVYAYHDPNPIIKQQGIKQLKEKGIECAYVDIEEINTFYKAYSHWWTTGKPWVTIKLAISSDKKIAGENGKPIKITSDKINLLTHKKRLTSDAILSTARTIINDNPKLNARLHNQTFSKPVFVLDHHSELPKNAHIHETAKSIHVFKEKGLENILKTIGKQGIHQLWVEVGSRCFNRFIDDKYADEIILYTTESVIGKAGLNANISPALHENYKANKKNYSNKTMIIALRKQNTY
jgi:diaminohydroxyphosphoribosylaminopyrimidine deaminase / 5-amino-6-(5-phosphoribosylamino)uracil reductase